MHSTRTNRRATRHAWVGIGALAASALIAASAPQVWAGPPAEGPRPVLSPWTLGAELEGVESTLHHAAGLGFITPLELGLGFTTRLQGGEAINSVTGLLGGRLGPFGLGLGVSGVGDGPGTSTSTTRVDVGVGLRLGDGIAVGFQWYGLYHGVDLDIRRFSTWSLSTTLRPFRALSVGLAVDRINSPRLGDAEHDPIGRLSLGFRPGTERATLGAELGRVFGTDGAWTAGGTLRAMIVPGLVLGGYGRYRTAAGLDAAQAEFGAFLGLYQGGMSLETSFDARDPGDGMASSLSTLLKARAERHPSLVRRGDLVVRLPVRGSIPERATEAALFFGSGPSPFGRWLQVLDVLARDPDVAGLILTIEAAPSWGQMWELRRAIARIQANGKRVFAVLTVGDMRAMYLASAADEVHLYVGGGLMLTGLSATRTYLKDLLANLGVGVEIVKWAEYKSASEALTEDGPTEPAREQDRAILDRVFGEWRRAVAEGRRLTPEQVDRVLAEGPQHMRAAQSAGLVDSLIYDDAISDVVRAALGPDATVVDRYRPSPRAWARWGGTRKIAVLPLVGSIVEGQSAGAVPLPILGGETTGDRSFIQALEAAVSRSDVVGIVIRVNSGGGSAIASDKMYRAVQRAARQKPLAVSFGNAAASGGYYAAAGAPWILASPLTVTGSIGIFTGKADLSALYRMIGVATHTERTHDRADMFGSHRGWTEAERLAAQDTLRAYYERFVSVVAEGRKLELARAFEHAAGRVFLGDEAIERGLVDAQGGLWDAISRVRAEAGIAPHEPIALEYVGSLNPLSGIQRLVGGVLGVEVAAPEPQATAGLLGHAAELLTRLRALEQGGPMALLPYTLVIE